MAIEFQPYVGPRPFEQENRAIFFGRERESRELLSLVIAQGEVLLYAPSGAGKTSLINAGLIPMLKEKKFEVLPLARVSGPIPETIKPKEIPNLYVFNTLMSWTESEANPRRLAEMSLADFLNERVHPTDEMGLPLPRVVIFDQFEELLAFYQEHWIDRKGFFEQVAEAMEGDSLLRVVFVIREDSIAQLDPYAPLLPEKLRTRFHLERLRKKAALSAITGPLAGTKRFFAEGVAERLVEELLKVRVTTSAGETIEAIGEFVEPVQLQVVLQSLWRGLSPDVTIITRDHLQAFGDVNQALSGFYERSISRAAQEVVVKEGNLRKWFQNSLITPAGTRGTVYQGWEKTEGIPNAAVDVLENLHLIRGEWRAGARWYELPHDRFIGPIQRSNEAWRAMQHGRRLRIGGAIAAVVILLFMGIAVFQAIKATSVAQQLSQVEATATAALGSESQATRFARALQTAGVEAAAASTRLVAVMPQSGGTETPSLDPTAIAAAETATAAAQSLQIAEQKATAAAAELKATATAKFKATATTAASTTAAARESEEALTHIRDRDGDDIPDAEDACPDEPGSPLARGCPKPTPTITPGPTWTPTVSIPITRTVEITGGVKVQMVYVPAGEFLRGTSDKEVEEYIRNYDWWDRKWFSDEQPQRPITLNDFWIDMTEVTNRQFEQFVRATGYVTGTGNIWNKLSGKFETDPAVNWRRPQGPSDDWSYKADHPVVQVSWEDANAYCLWRGARLPTEAEWEKAAGWDDEQKRKRIWPWGNNLPTGKKLNYCDVNCILDWRDRSINDGFEATAPVGNYLGGASPYGVLDMSGNVWEWVADYYDERYYEVSPAENPPGPDADTGRRVLRGGSWFQDYAEQGRAASRFFAKPDTRNFDIGFRCAQSP